ncbi:PITH domain-containing protein [Collybia nuda]|uniref:PITH domain-containing protein n=1 Tax=Collybia nuda TaxID=64659 RepID=A0A9P5XYY9_9AGAR|nr:PITH domain-containing protein [Collybia nuda]
MSTLTSTAPQPGTGSKDGADTSLLQYLDLSQLNCLNEASDHTLKSILDSKSLNKSTNHLLSDADEQLLLNIPFNQTVRVRSIVIRSANEEQAPRELKILANRPNVGFADVEDAEEPAVAQVLTISESNTRDGAPIGLRYVRFQAVNTLHIFVATNGGADETRIDAIDIFGIPAETTKDLSGLRKQED